MRFLFLLFFVPVILFAQDEKVDSLENVLSSSKSFDEKKEASFLLGEHLVQRNPERAEEIANELSQNWVEASDSIEIARVNYIYAASHRWQGNYATALEFYESNYNFFKRNDDLLEVAKSGHFIGTLHMFLGNNVKSQEHLLEVANIYEKHGTARQKARIANSLAGFYLNVDQLEKGRDKYIDAMKQFEELNDSSGLASTNANLGMVYTYLGEYDKAEDHLLRQKSYNVIFPTLREMGFHHDFMGNLRQAQGRTQEAYEEHQKALEIRKGLSSTYNLCESRLNMGEILIDLKRYDEAIVQLNEVFAFDEHQSLNQQNAAYELLALAYEKKGNYKQALRQYKNFKEMSDSIYTKESIDVIAENDARYKKQEQDAEIALLSKEKEIAGTKLSRSRILLFGSLLCLALLSGFAFYAYKANQKIKTKNSVIQRALEEKELLMREIHHRVKNNLQIISSLLKLQANYVEDETALDALQKGRNRVQSMALLHKNLYSENDITSVDMQSYFRSLVESIFQSYRLSEKDIQLDLDVDDVKLDVDSVIPIGLIINELITNSLKHAFTEGQEIQSKIEVKLKEESERLRLVVKDNGKGISEEVLLKHREEGSFGQNMVRSFVKKLKAELILNRENGTEVAILIPKV